ncbi:MAG: TPM domain-containing protein [Chitinophagaceae bacterium]|nr:TPM domain-containing protein [Chitinophagaceae bacterium]
MLLLQKISCTLFLIICSSLAYSTGIYTVENLPDPKSSPGFQYVSNPDHVLSESTVAGIDSLLKNLELTTTCQVAVVVVNSIGETVPKSFATQLFNYWGIGDREKDNGLLILMVMDQRSIEFETGKGMEGILPDVTCKYIQEQFMVPYAKAGNYDACIFGGVKAVITYITDPKNAPEVMAENSSAFGQSFTDPLQEPFSFIYLIAAGIIYLLLLIIFRPKKNEPGMKEYVAKYNDNSYWWVKTLIINIGFPVAYLWSQFTYDPPLTIAEFIIAFYIFLIVLLIEHRLRVNQYIEKFYETDRAAAHLALTKSNRYWTITYFLFPIPFLLYKFFKDQKLKRIRNAPYTCDHCSSLMTRLDENSDDQYLSKTQLVEEQIHSVDYDVWHCYHCGNQSTLIYPNISSKYSECKHCKARTSYIKGRITTKPPSYTSSGVGKKIIDCMNCHQTDEVPYTIPMLVHSSSSGGSSGSSGSSGGSSWGGGSSGGGGAGSRW